VVGVSAAGRGMQVKVTPVQISTQWSIDRIQTIAVASQARPEDA